MASRIPRQFFFRVTRRYQQKPAVLVSREVAEVFDCDRPSMYQHPELSQGHVSSSAFIGQSMIRCGWCRLLQCSPASVSIVPVSLLEVTPHATRASRAWIHGGRFAAHMMHDSFSYGSFEVLARPPTSQQVSSALLSWNHPMSLDHPAGTPTCQLNVAMGHIASIYLCTSRKAAVNTVGSGRRLRQGSLPPRHACDPCSPSAQSP